MRVSETGIPGIFVRHYPSGRTRFWWTIRDGRKRFRRASKRNTLRGAVAEREKALVRLAAGQPVDEREKGAPYSVANACLDYLKACESLRSYATCRLHSDKLIEHFGELAVAGLSQVAMASFRKRRMEEEVSPATVNRALSFLRAALNHAKGEGRIEGDHYFARLSKADRRKVFVEEVRTAGLRRVSDAQIKSVIGKLPAPFQPIARLLLATGMRKGEALWLRWGEVREGSLYLTRTKSGKPRWVPLTKQAEGLLPSRPEDAADDDPVFLGRDGGNAGNNFDRAWRAAREAEGVNLPWLRVHDLRHEAASRYLEAGGTLRELQELGGWSDLKMVERYSKVTRERIRETLSKVPQPSAESTLSPRVEGGDVRIFAK
jgi:integrase